VSIADIAALESLGNSFETFPPDSFYQADVSLAVDNKNATRDDLEIKVRDVVQCAEIKWGVGSPQYKKFGAGKMTVAGDKEFLVICRQVVTAATGYLTDLTPVGLTQAMIDAVSTGSQNFEDNLNAIRDAVEQRDLKTQERITDGNEIYSFVVTYCNIGKIIWDDVDEAKYNDYVIYPKTPDVPGKVLNLAYDTPTHTLSWDAAPKADVYQAEYKSTTPGFDWAVIYEGAELSCVHDPGSGSWNYRCRGHNDEGYGDWSDELLVIIPV